MWLDIRQKQYPVHHKYILLKTFEFVAEKPDGFPVPVYGF
jgi:hypothetical protein